MGKMNIVTDFEEECFNEYANSIDKFVITSPEVADWAIRKIKDRDEEFDRLISMSMEREIEYKAKTLQLKENKEKANGFLKAALFDYMQTVKCNETKTQKTYKLLSGTLVEKKPSYNLVHDDEKLASFAPEFTEQVNKFRWGDYKKTLNVVDGEVIDENGETVPYITVEEVPGEFEIK